MNHGGLIDLQLSDFFIPNFHRSSCRHQYQLYLPVCKSRIRFISLSRVGYMERPLTETKL